MRIAIIGAGSVGAALARAGVSAGHTVTVTATDPLHAKAVADETGATAATSNVDAAADAELVVLAVPHGAVNDVAVEIADVVEGKTVVDSTNPLNDTYSDLVIETTSAAQDLQQRLPGAFVVKAFNTIFAARHGNPVEDGVVLDAFIAGNNDAAKTQVADFAASLGYRVIDAGSLRLARALEEMALLNITLNARNGWGWQSGWKLVGPTGQA